MNYFWRLKIHNYPQKDSWRTLTLKIQHVIFLSWIWWLKHGSKLWVQELGDESAQFLCPVEWCFFFFWSFTWPRYQTSSKSSQRTPTILHPVTVRVLGLKAATWRHIKMERCHSPEERIGTNMRQTTSVSVNERNHTWPNDSKLRRPN